MKIKVNEIQAVHDTAEAVGGKVRTDYSGRGMFGRTCYAIDCTDKVECIEQAARFGLNNAKYDNMGENWIVYWPHIVENNA